MATILGLAVLAFLAGTAFGNFQQRDTGGATAADGGAAGPVATDADAGDPADGEAPDVPTPTTPTATATDDVPVGDGDAGAGSDPAQQRLGFDGFDEPVQLIGAETDAAFNNSTGVDLERFGGPFDGDSTEAVVADLLVRGAAGTTVALHPGDRPTDALRFTIPASGRLLVQHLLAVPDDAGRITVSTSEQADVQLTGHGRFLPAAQASAGRFVPTGSTRIGSLVTATDGRTLIIDLDATLGDEADHVGQAVVRLNANVGPDGGSVSVGSGEPIPWPAPAVADLAMAGTELLTVRPTSEGEIEMEYLGGNVMTVDLIGYYTNDAAPESTEGLLVLADGPRLDTVEIGDATAGIVPGGATGRVEAASGGSVAVIEVANGTSPGMVTVWSGLATEPAESTFALAPSQQRSTTAWLPHSFGQDHHITGPVGATVQIWTLGTYT